MTFSKNFEKVFKTLTGLKFEISHLLCQEEQAIFPESLKMIFSILLFIAVARSGVKNPLQHL